MDLSYQRVDVDDPELVRYLLGHLPDDEAERLEEAAVIDDEFAARLRVAEHDLVDAYVKGGLDDETLARFESHYLTSPRRRANVRFAESFLRAVDRAGRLEARDAPAPAAVPAEPVRHRFRLVPRLMAAAAALLLVASSVLLVDRVQLKRGLQATVDERTALDRRANALEQQLAAEQAAQAAVRRQLERAEQSAHAAPAAVMVLLPQTRALGPIPVIAVPAGVERVAFDLRLEVSGFGRYQVALKDPATGRIVWQSDALVPGPSRRPLTIAVSVPASLLKPQHYSLDVRGLLPTGAREIVGSYTFQVESR
jgi:hypothetical protein